MPRPAHVGISSPLWLVAGAALWLVALVALPPDVPLQARITLGGPLLVVPLMLGAVRTATLPLRPATAVVILAAAPLVPAMALPPGVIAALLALPWLIVGGATDVAAIAHGLRGLPGILAPHQLATLGQLAAFTYLGVGATFLFFDRLGVQPGGFSVAIILLTAVHFHFAGFGLVTIAVLLAAEHPVARLPVLGLVAGIPITAAGMVTGVEALNALGSVITAAAGIGVGLALIAGARSWPAGPGIARAVAGTALLVAMPLAIAWSVGPLLGWAFLDIERMVRTHGALNAAAVLVAGAAFRRAGAGVSAPILGAHVAPRHDHRHRWDRRHGGSHDRGPAQG